MYMYNRRQVLCNGSCSLKGYIQTSYINVFRLGLGRVWGLSYVIRESFTSEDFFCKYICMYI